MRILLVQPSGQQTTRQEPIPMSTATETDPQAADPKAAGGKAPASVPVSKPAPQLTEPEREAQAWKEAAKAAKGGSIDVIDAIILKILFDLENEAIDAATDAEDPDLVNLEPAVNWFGGDETDSVTKRFRQTTKGQPFNKLPLDERRDQLKRAGVIEAVNKTDVRLSEAARAKVEAILRRFKLAPAKKAPKPKPVDD
jgi:hypothetical protein